MFNAEFFTLGVKRSKAIKALAIKVESKMARVAPVEAEAA